MLWACSLPELPHPRRHAHNSTTPLLSLLSPPVKSTISVRVCPRAEYSRTAKGPDPGRVAILNPRVCFIVVYECTVFAGSCSRGCW
jgi:hypothetical protein